MNAKILECANDLGVDRTGAEFRGWLYLSDLNQPIVYASDVMVPEGEPVRDPQQQQEQSAQSSASQANNMPFGKISGDALRRMAVQSFQSGQVPGFPGVLRASGRGRVPAPRFAVPGGIRLH
jgi:hypothetical protein